MALGVSLLGTAHVLGQCAVSSGIQRSGDSFQTYSQEGPLLMLGAGDVHSGSEIQESRYDEVANFRTECQVTQ